MFRQVSEEQRKMSEDRYRSVLLEAVQDAVFLSAQNQQLQADNSQLRKGQSVLPSLIPNPWSSARQEMPRDDLSSQQQVNLLFSCYSTGGDEGHSNCARWSWCPSVIAKRINLTKRCAACKSQEITFFGNLLNIMCTLYHTLTYSFTLFVPDNAKKKTKIKLAAPFRDVWTHNSRLALFEFTWNISEL